MRSLLIITSMLACAGCKRATPPEAPAPAVSEDVTAPPSDAPSAAVSPDDTSSEAPAEPAPTDTDPDAAARAEEEAWYAEVPERRAQVAALPALAGDACALSADSEAGVFRVGGFPVFFPLGPDVSNASAASQSPSILNVRQGDVLYAAFATSDAVFDTLRSGAAEAAELGGDVAHTLWRIDCTKPTARPTVHFAAASPNGFDFGNALAGPDGHALYGTSDGALARFNIATKSLEVMSAAPRCAPWNFAIDSESNCTRAVVPVALSDGELEIVAVTAEVDCHGSGARMEHFVVDPTRPETYADPHRWTPVATVAFVAEVGSELWLGSEQLWRSRDGGASWEQLASPRSATDDDSQPESIETLLVDGANPKRVLVITRVETGNRGEVGGRLFASDDGGAHWRRAGPTDEEDDTPAIALWSLDGSLKRIAVARAWQGEEPRVLESLDGGKSWEATEASPPAVERTLPPGFVRTRRGLWRVEPTGARTLVFPPPNLDIPICIDSVPLRATVPRTPIDWQTWDKARDANKAGLAQLKRALRFDRASGPAFDAALASFREAWGIDPDNVVARYNAACAYARQGKADDALELLEEIGGIGGFRARTLLAAAGGDPDLVTLRKLERFKVLSAARAPELAFDRTFEGFAFDVGTVVMSDAAERLCVLVEPVEPMEEGDELALRRFDCDGAERGTLVGATPKELAGTLEELGMTGWSSIDADSPDHEAASAWALTDPPRLPAQALVALHISPSRQRIAARIAGEDADGDAIETVVFGPWPAPR